MQYSPRSEVWRFDEAIAHYAAVIRIPIAEVTQVVRSKGREEFVDL